MEIEGRELTVTDEGLDKAEVVPKLSVTVAVIECVPVEEPGE